MTNTVLGGPLTYATSDKEYAKAQFLNRKGDREQLRQGAQLLFLSIFKCHSQEHFAVANYSSETSLLTCWSKGSLGEDCLAQRMQLLICWKMDFARKFVTLQRGSRDCFFRLSLNCFHPLYPFFWALFFPTRLILPWNAGEREELLMCTSNCYQSVIRFSLLLLLYFFSLSFYTGLCSALLTNKTLRRRVEFAPQKLWCIGFFTVRAAPPTAFSFSVVLRTIFSVFAIFTLSPSLPSLLRLSGYHLQFNAYLGWALTIASTMKWSRPCLHA